MSDTDWFAAGKMDCIQDRCENCPFASIGGLEQRLSPEYPRWVPVRERYTWLNGYLDAALSLYGDDWQTCEFSWRMVLTINGNE